MNLRQLLDRFTSAKIHKYSQMSKNVGIILCIVKLFIQT